MHCSASTHPKVLVRSRPASWAPKRDTGPRYSAPQTRRSTWHGRRGSPRPVPAREEASGCQGGHGERGGRWWAARLARAATAAVRALQRARACGRLSVSQLRVAVEAPSGVASGRVVGRGRQARMPPDVVCRPHAVFSTGVCVVALTRSFKECELRVL